MTKAVEKPLLTAALVTAAGEGGISVIVLSGQGASRLVEERLKSPSGRPRPLCEGRLAYGLLCDAGGAVLDEVIVACRSAGLLEVNCHGGLLPARRILASLSQSGVAIAAPGAIPEALIARGPIEQEAFAALLDARTDLAARVLAAQVGGTLSASLAGIAELIESSAPDRDVVRQLQALSDTARFGIALTSPRTVAVVGPVNAGKSSIVNWFAGHERNIVTDVPGTTRDAVNVPVAVLGMPLTLVDTAGAGAASDDLTVKAARKAAEAAEKADALLFVVDSSVALPVDRPAPSEGRPILVAANKSDLPGAPKTLEKIARWGVPAVRTSALTGQGMAELSRALLGAAGTGVPPKKIAEGPVVFSRRLLDAVRAAMGAMETGQRGKAFSAITACLSGPPR